MRDVPKVMEVVMRVRLGLMTAVHAAAELGVSRKTYYEWEAKALTGMSLSLEPGSPGRPPNQVDQEKEELKDQLQKTQKQLILAEQNIEIRKILFGDIPDGLAS